MRRVALPALALALFGPTPAAAQIRWSKPVRVHDIALDRSSLYGIPAIAHDPSGGTFVAWLARRGSGEFVFHVAPWLRGARLGAAATVAADDRVPETWQLTVSPTGLPGLVWEQRDANAIFAARGKPEGGFGPAIGLATPGRSGGGAVGHAAAAWADGRDLVAGWTLTRGSPGARNVGAIESAVVGPDGVEGRQRLAEMPVTYEPSDLGLARTSAGSVVAAWAAEDGAAGYAIRPAAGSFGAPSNVGDPKEDYVIVKLRPSAVAPDGFTAAWEGPCSHPREAPGSEEDVSRCRFAALTDGNGSGRQLERIGGETDYGQEVDLAVTPDDRTLFAYTNYESAQGPMLAERPPGGSFTPPTPFASLARAFAPVLAPTSSGPTLFGTSQRYGFHAWLLFPDGARRSVRTLPSDMERRPAVATIGRSRFLIVSGKPIDPNYYPGDLIAHAGVIDVVSPVLRYMRARLAAHPRRIEIHLSASERGSATLRLTRVGGKRVLSRRLGVRAGRNRLKIRVRSRPARYRLRVRLTDLAANRSGTKTATLRR